MSRRQQQRGLTVIELIMVILIIGVLSAFALPKFANLGSDDEAAKLDGVLGAVKSASGIVRSVYLANGSVDPTLEGQVFTTVNGYLDRDDVALVSGFTCGVPGTDDDQEFDCFTVGANSIVIGLDGRIDTADDGSACIKYTESAGTGPSSVATGVLSGSGTDCT